MELIEAQNLYLKVRRDQDSLRSEVERIRGELAERLSRLQGLGKILEGLVVGYPEIAAKPTPASALQEHAEEEHAEEESSADEADPGETPKPISGKTAALRLMEEDPDKWVLISELVSEAIKRGWYTGTLEDNLNRVRVAVIRMADEGIVEREPEKFDRNAYRYRLLRNRASEAGASDTPASLTYLFQTGEEVNGDAAPS